MTSHNSWAGYNSRHIVERIVVQLDLRLVTPAHLGNGDDEDLTDMPLLTDLRQPGVPILLGTSLGGALRAAVRRWQHGHFHSSQSGSQGQKKDWSHLLFGDPVDPSGKNSEHQLQSPLLVDDALAIDAQRNPAKGKTEIRDGVRLNSSSRTAEDKGLYSAEFWRPGTVFPLRLELLLCESASPDTIGDLKRALAVALACLNDAASERTVTLGARKRRGFGVVHAENWRYRRFDLKTVSGLKDWLNEAACQPRSYSDINSALLGTNTLPEKQGREFKVSGNFFIDGSLLIRSGTVQDDLDVDMVHLHSAAADGSEVPVLSGTTLAGALRQRCWAIAELIGGEELADQIVQRLFGPEMGFQQSRKSGHASRISIQEAEIQGATSGDDRLIQSRVSIDRFTGGALDTALFNEQPVYGPRVAGRDVLAPLSFTIHDPCDEDIGLFLLALKDLATGDLPVGGESSVGRGLLKLTTGLTILERNGGPPTQLMIGPNGETRTSEDRDKLNGYVNSLHNPPQRTGQTVQAESS